MRVLITGGAGFIGSNLSKYLYSKGYEIFIIDNFSTGKLENIKKSEGYLNFAITDIREPFSFEIYPGDFDFIVHLAAITSVQKSIENPSLTYEVNVEGTKIVLDFAKKKGVKRFIFASSCSVYGDQEYLPVSEEAKLSPLSPYAISKVEGERLCKLYAESGVETVVLRFFNVFGPNQDYSSPYSGVISIFINKMIKGENPIIYGDGEQTRDFIYVGDVVRAIEKAFFADITPYRIFNIGSGRSFSINQVFEIIKEITSFRGSPIFEKARKGELRHIFSDISKAEKYLGWKPEIPFGEGLEKTFEYMLGGSNGKREGP
ncbi:MAG: NAD-dependent epimerase/dehydratase family protein [Candidatus Aminicenantia bacterium]